LNGELEPECQVPQAVVTCYCNGVQETFRYSGVVSISQIQLESGDESSDFVVDDSSKTLLECQRNYEVGASEMSILHDGQRRCYGLVDNIPFKSTKYRNPQVCMSEVSYSGTIDAQNLRILNKSSRKFTTTADIMRRAYLGYGSYTSGVEYNWVADSEMAISMNNRTYIEY